MPWQPSSTPSAHRLLWLVHPTRITRCADPLQNVVLVGLRRRAIIEFLCTAWLSHMQTERQLESEPRILMEPFFRGVIVCTVMPTMVSQCFAASSLQVRRPRQAGRGRAPGFPALLLQSTLSAARSHTLPHSFYTPPFPNALSSCFRGPIEHAIRGLPKCCRPAMPARNTAVHSQTPQEYLSAHTLLSLSEKPTSDIAL